MNTNISSAASQNQPPVTLREFLTVMVTSFLVLVLVASVLSMVPIYREGKGGIIPAVIPAGDVLDAKIWLNAETSGNHTYIRLSDGDVPVAVYSDGDIQHLILPLFESRNKVRVLSWSKDQRVFGNWGRRYTRGLYLEHEPFR